MSHMAYNMHDLHRILHAIARLALLLVGGMWQSRSCCWRQMK